MTRITSDDPLQPGYSYSLECETGKNFNSTFKPELSPEQMLKLGVFDGFYFHGYHGEYPSDWFKNARLSSGGFDEACNFYEIHASQPLKVWQEKGWIYPDDPRGWFQWYCRYYLGRRKLEEDQRQIKRWRAFSRHAGQIKANCFPGDLTCRRKQRQALLHWAYDSREL